MREKWAAEAAGRALTPGPDTGRPAASGPILEGGRRDRRRRERLAAAAAGENPAAAPLDRVDGIDPEALAQQRALAARAALQNRRTAQLQRDAVEAGAPPAPGNDPAAVTNLAMVTPLEFVTVPGVDFPVMKPPATSHIPIITPASAEPAAGQPAEPAAGQAASAEPAEPAAAAAPPPSSRSGVAVAEPLEPVIAGARPVGARSAFGLDPLDVMTAGLGRTRKLRFAVSAVAGLGALALIIGIVMTVGGFGS